MNATHGCCMQLCAKKSGKPEPDKKKYAMYSQTVQSKIITAKANKLHEQRQERYRSNVLECFMSARVVCRC